MRATVVDGPQPPLEDRTNGVKVPFSTWLAHDSLLICTSLLLLMSSVASFGGGHAIVGRMGVEDPDIKKGTSLAFVPKVLCSDV